MALVASMIVIGLFANTQVEDPRGGKIVWSADLSAGLEEAKEKNQPVMLYFTADW